VDERALTELRGLAEADHELERTAAELRALDADVAGIRGRAEAIAAFFATYATEQAAREQAIDEARNELALRNDELRRAEQTAAEARDEVGREHAAKAVERARDHIAIAQARLARAEAARTELELQASTLPGELAGLDLRAHGLAEVSPPAGDLVDWASRAHAELFVAAGQIDARRERAIREANELASMLTGESTYGSTAAQALAAAERHWTSSPGHVSESR
jgi:chromosome segregation ATPase